MLKKRLNVLKNNFVGKTSSFYMRKSKIFADFLCTHMTIPQSKLKISYLVEFVVFYVQKSLNK